MAAESNNERIDELFGQALDREKSARQAFLDAACAGDESLRAEVEKLLEADAAAGGRIGNFLSSASVNVAALLPEMGGAAGAVAKEKTIEEPPEKSFSPNVSTISFAQSADGGAQQLAPQDVTEKCVALQAVSLGRFGDYELLEEIARGGMGVVYRAKHAKLNRTVALKMILPGRTASDAIVKRFYSEAEAVARLDHSGIVPIYDFGQVNEQHFFSMALVEGGSLAARVKNEGPLPPREAAQLLQALATAVQYAHDRGVIHRDLKPGNVLLSRDGLPRITDFGLAKLADDDSGLSTTGEILGTPSYMAPEQAAGQIREVGPLADVYALGAIQYCLLVGRPPFQAATQLETLRQVREVEPLSVRLLNPGVPRDLDTICLKCLQKSSRQRYGSAKELADDLNRYLRGEPILARPVNTLERAWRWCRQRPTLSGLALVLLTIVCVASFVLVEQRARLESASLAAQLLSAKITEVPRLIQSMEPFRSRINPLLHSALADAQKTQNVQQQLHLHMALLSVGDEHFEYVFEQLLAARPEAAVVLRKMLVIAKAKLVPRLWEHVTRATPPLPVLPAGSALAEWDSGSERWPMVAPMIVEHLLTQQPLETAAWTEQLKPVAATLRSPLRKAFSDASRPEIERSVAATILGEYLAEDMHGIVDLIGDANAIQFKILFPRLASQSFSAIELLDAQLSPPEVSGSEPTWDKNAAQQVGAALALLRLGQGKGVWPLLHANADRRIRSLLLHRFAEYDVDPRSLLAQFERESDVSIQRALVLALGTFDPRKLPTSFSEEEQVNRMIKRYSATSDAGLHSALGWLMRLWGRQESLSAADSDVPLGRINRGRNWFVNRERQSFVAISGPVEFTMGTGEFRFAGDRAERPHQRLITRSFAMAVTEVTVEEFDRFLQATSQNQPDTYRATSVPRAPRGSVTWYDAAAYCNWLSEQEGLPPHQWCFEKGKTEEFQQWDLAPNYLQRIGYRLPTEAEWEFACRAGSNSTRHYGDSRNLLDHYAWTLQNAPGQEPVVVGQLMPNDLGLFDMYGNVWEWCLDRFHGFGTVSSSDRIEDREDQTVEVAESVARCYRGGACNHPSDDARSGRRGRTLPTNRSYNIGFRLARTIRTDEG